MKNKASLTLIEQVIMLLVLAVSAAVCIQFFVQAHLTAQKNYLQDLALQQVQNVAENIKTTGNLEQTAEKLQGSMDSGILTIEYEKFMVIAEQINSENPLLGRANVMACDGDQIYAQLQICWQEVGS